MICHRKEKFHRARFAFRSVKKLTSSNSRCVVLKNAVSVSRFLYFFAPSSDVKRASNFHLRQWMVFQTERESIIRNFASINFIVSRRRWYFYGSTLIFQTRRYVEIKLAMYNIILILVYLEPRQAYIGSIVVAIRCNVFECR